MKIERTFKDIEFTVLMIKKDDDAHVDFKAYSVAGTYLDGTYLYNQAESDSFEPTKNIDKAQVFLSGHIKWDGCSNMKFDEQDHVMLHFCKKKSAQDVGKLMGYLYDMAIELMPENKKYLQ